MNKSRYRLSRQLRLGIMLLAVPIFILSLGVLFVQSRYLIHQEVSESSYSMLNTTLHRVRTYMGTIETAANSNIWMLEEDFCPDTLKSVSNRIVRLNPPVSSSSVFVVPDISEEYGHNYSLYSVDLDDTVATYCETDYDYFDKPFYIRPLITGEACWIDPYQDNADWGVDYNKATAIYCQPIKQEDGRIVGVLTADLSFSRMAKMINEVEQPYPQSYFILLGGDGRYLIHPDTTRLFRKTIFTDADPGKDKDLITLGHEMTTGKQGTMHIHLDGQLYHVSYVSVPGTDWSLALVCPDSSAMKSYYGLGYVIIALLVIGLLLILFLCNRVVKQTISPISKLTGITQKIADGKYEEPIPVSTRKDVFGQLQNSFAKMQQSLNEHMGSLQQQADEIRQHNEELQHTKQQAEDTVRRKNQFIRHVTQQMRMPLNVITGFADVLGESGTDKSTINKEELDSITDMLKNNVINMNRMVLMLFDASETDAKGKLLCTRTDELSCNKISKEVVDHIVRLFPGTNIQFETELRDSIQILTNRIFLLCVLIEPLYNAVHYSDGKHIIMHVSQTATTVKFTIQDTGPGMPPEMPEQVFKPFQEIDNLLIGVGIGLPLARRHAIGLGGSLTIDTDYHEGCRIVIEMPK